MFVFAGILVLLLAGAQPATATQRHVPSPYPTIQAAIHAAVTGDVVIIAPGTCTGDGNRDLDGRYTPGGQSMARCVASLTKVPALFFALKSPPCGRTMSVPVRRWPEASRCSTPCPID
jgi:hypothetical protein